MELRAERGDVTWSFVAFGNGLGGFASDPKRGKAFHEKALAEALSRLQRAPALKLHDGVTPCAEAIAPALEAYGQAHLGRLPPKPVRLATRRWFSRVEKSLGPNWKQLCPRAAELLVCVEALESANPDGFRRCLRIEPD